MLFTSFDCFYIAFFGCAFVPSSPSVHVRLEENDKSENNVAWTWCKLKICHFIFLLWSRCFYLFVAEFLIVPSNHNKYTRARSGGKTFPFYLILFSSSTCHLPFGFCGTTTVHSSLFHFNPFSPFRRHLKLFLRLFLSISSSQMKILLLNQLLLRHFCLLPHNTWTDNKFHDALTQSVDTRVKKNWQQLIFDKKQQSLKHLKNVSRKNRIVSSLGIVRPSLIFHISDEPFSYYITFHSVLKRHFDKLRFTDWRACAEEAWNSIPNRFTRPTSLRLNIEQMCQRLDLMSLFQVTWLNSSDHVFCNRPRQNYEIKTMTGDL